MEINCPKCNKALTLLGSTSNDKSLGPAGETIKAEGVHCDECGWIPFVFFDDDGDDFELGPNTIMVAHFRLLKALGKGGFGVVWLAEDVHLGRHVALKIPSASGQSVSMLLHEAQSAAKLRHPNIVSVFETGKSSDGQAFIASEYIDGLNLRDILTAGRPTHETLIQLLITITDALHHAHQAGIIHRDIKPANIMLDHKGVPYVADFGLAKQVSANQSISSEGQVLGTANYMSPEQATGLTKITDHRTDIYAVGVMLFEMLTGHLPFRGNTRAVMHQKTTEDAPSPRTLEPSVPKDLETICLKCLERDPEKRFSSALLLKDELIRVKRGEPILARPIGSIEKLFRWSRRFPLVAGLSAGLVFSLMAGLIGVTLFWQDASRNAAIARNSVYRSQMSLAAQHFVQGDVRGIRTSLDRISSDDELMRLRDFSWNYYDRLLDCFPTTVVHGDQVESVAVSSDGRLLTTVGYEGFCAVWNAESGELLSRARPEGGKFTAADFSPTRLQLATGDSNGFVSIWNPNELDVPLKSIMHGPVVTSVKYSRDGEYLLTFGKRGAVRVWRLDSEDLIAEFPSGPSGTNSAEFSPDGTKVIVGGDQGILRVWSISEQQTLFQIKNGPEEEEIVSLCFSADGTRIAVAGGRGNYRIYSAEDGELITENYTYQGKLGSAIFLKGGSLLACTGTVKSLEIYNIEQGQSIAIYPTHRLGAGVASLSSNGRFLAIGSGDGTAKVLRVDRLQQPQILWHDSPVYQLAFSRDGGAIMSLGPSGEVLRHSLQDSKSSVLVNKSDSEYRMFEVNEDASQIIRGVPQPVIEITSIGNTQSSTEKFRTSSLSVPYRSLAGIHADNLLHQLIVVSRSGSVLAYELNNPSGPQEELQLDEGEVVVVAGSVEQHQLAVGFEDGRIFVLGLKPLRIQHEFKSTSTPSAIDFCRQLLVVGLNFGGIQLHDLGSSSVVQPNMVQPKVIEGHGAEITAITSFPDGRSFVTGSRDHLIKIWDVTSGDAITTLYGHNRQIFSLAVSPDGKTLVSGGLEGDIHLWRSGRD